ncbi:6022_t:CDS:2, partial [Ambispora gerdemannii]
AVEAQSLRELSDFLAATVRQTLPLQNLCFVPRQNPPPQQQKGTSKPLYCVEKFNKETRNSPQNGKTKQQGQKVGRKDLRPVKGSKLPLTNASNQNVTDNLKNSRRPSNNNDNGNVIMRNLDGMLQQLAEQMRTQLTKLDLPG